MKDGGPAFPCKLVEKYYSEGERERVVDWPGISLRDYFAARAMQAMITKSDGSDQAGGKKGVPLVAKFAYEYADAMIEARKL